MQPVPTTPPMSGPWPHSTFISAPFLKPAPLSSRTNHEDSNPRRRQSTSNYKPVHSSPLANFSSSPTTDDEDDRSSQMIPSSPTYGSSYIHESPVTSRRKSAYKPTGRLLRSSRSQKQRPIYVPLFDGEESEDKKLLRARFREKCFERAKRERSKAISKTRRKGDYMDDEDERGHSEDYDDDDDDDDAFLGGDELFSRIMTSLHSKSQYEYRVSYQDEVGSSFDPDMEDVGQWEKDMKGSPCQISNPVDLELEELEAYADDYCRHLSSSPPKPIHHGPDAEMAGEEDEFDALWDDIPEDALQAVVVNNSDRKTETSFDDTMDIS